ncbi:hypothetical protein BKH41_06915 [Helicobacter sp. 12S02232-10]|uniref:O-antigen ligase family protein n=1 Tax=Helicobacter sp. 12S02232-10 TaxID=1476197 RepID=UPI000BA5CC17|nr:O-antigen ligase family protein [Helicobacter sp. 12S02232-10]PAF47622.1 hypothetical protein BKH41_06915 [Helicobacter sp. 12S02232-10]
MSVLLKIFPNKIISLSILFLVAGFFMIGANIPDRFGAIFLLVGGLLYAYYIYKSDFNFRTILREFYPIWFWILSYLGVVFMALVSVHFAFDTQATLKAIGLFLILPLILSLFFYFVIKNLSQKALRFFLILLGGMIFFHPLATIYDYFINHSDRATGFGEALIIPYGMFLILSFALGMTMVVYLSGKWRFFSYVAFGISLLAIYANGTRALILSVATMIFVALFFLHIKYKKIIIPIVFVFLTGIGIGVIFLSSHFSDRFNFKKMLEHISVVWHYAPSEMGRFDKRCFINYLYKCSEYSGDKLDQRFSFESNALGRLSLWKSALLAIAENPFRPNGFYSRFFDKNILNVFKSSSNNHPYALNHSGKISFYDHIHNMPLSFIFELGIVGFLFIIINFCCMIRHFTSYLRQTNDFYETFFISFFIIFLSGFIISMFFDSMLSFFNFNSSFFILCGIFLGISCRKFKEKNVL